MRTVHPERPGEHPRFRLRKRRSFLSRADRGGAGGSFRAMQKPLRLCGLFIIVQLGLVAALLAHARTDAEVPVMIESDAAVSGTGANVEPGWPGKFLVKAPTPEAEAFNALPIMAQVTSSTRWVAHFSTLPPYAMLPTGAQCASMIAPSSWEPRPQNAAANHTVPTVAGLNAHNFYMRPIYSGSSPASDYATVDGNYTGTTDMIIRWAACKWGRDEDVLRAQAVNESHWIQSRVGDRRTTQSQCQRPYWNGWDGRGCYQSYGLLQVKVYDLNAWPEASTSTAFNADLQGAYFRACMNGHIRYLAGRVNPATGNAYPNNNTDEMLWGCIGQWYSGGWYDSGAQRYISHVRDFLAQKSWLRPGF